MLVWWGLSSSASGSVTIFLDAVAKDRRVGKFEQAHQTIELYRRKTAGSDPRLLEVAQTAEQQLDATEARVAEIAASVEEGAHLKSPGEQISELKSLKASGARQIDRESAHIVLGRYDRILRRARDRRVAEAERAPPKDKPVPADVVSEPSLQESLLAQIDSLAAAEQYVEAIEMLRQALSTTPLAESGPYRDRLARVSKSVQARVSGQLARAQQLEKAGKLAEAVKSLEGQTARYPAAEAARISSEIARLRGVALAGQVPKDEAAGGVARPSIAQANAVKPKSARATLQEISQLLEDVRRVEDSGDLARAQELLVLAAKRVATRDSDFALYLESKAKGHGQIVAMAKALADRLPKARAKDLRVELREGGFGEVIGVGGSKLTLKLATGERAVGWSELKTESLAELIERNKVGIEGLLGGAVMAYRDGDADIAERLLVRAAKVDRSRASDIDALIREGRGLPEEAGSFSLVGGQFVSQRQQEILKLSRSLERRLAGILNGKSDGWSKLLEELRDSNQDTLAAWLAALDRHQAALAKRIAGHPFRKAHGKLHTRRLELDSLREHAKELIFDEVKYFYPYRPPAVSGEKAAEYWPVQQEVDKRVAAIREIWESTERQASIPSKLREEFARYVWLRETSMAFGQPLDEVGPDVAWVMTLPSAKVLGLQNFCLSVAERERNELYARIEAYNIKILAGLPNAEQRQIKVTNAYRRMFNHRPLAVNMKIQRAARGHCEEMSTLGYFGHFSPTAGRRTPFDRMRLEGYQRGASENCATNGSAEGAHNAWIHSSGHHRNLLNPGHTEFGSGNSGKYWTQNFGRSSEFMGLPEFQ